MILYRIYARFFHTLGDYVFKSQEDASCVIKKACFKYANLDEKDLLKKDNELLQPVFKYWAGDYSREEADEKINILLAKDTTTKMTNDIVWKNAIYYDVFSGFALEPLQLVDDPNEVDLKNFDIMQTL